MLLATTFIYGLNQINTNIFYGGVFMVEGPDGNGLYFLALELMERESMKKKSKEEEEKEMYKLSSTPPEQNPLSSEGKYKESRG